MARMTDDEMTEYRRLLAAQAVASRVIRATRTEWTPGFLRALATYIACNDATMMFAHKMMTKYAMPVKVKVKDGA